MSNDLDKVEAEWRATSERRARIANGVTSVLDIALGGVLYAFEIGTLAAAVYLILKFTGVL